MLNTYGLLNVCKLKGLIRVTLVDDLKSSLSFYKDTKAETFNNKHTRCLCYAFSREIFFKNEDIVYEKVHVSGPCVHNYS